jgi:hypothetical protein
MKGVVLNFEDDAQLSMATAFLKEAHPLEHTAPVKKSQVSLNVRQQNCQNNTVLLRNE